jgi:N-methylhydantoinase A
VRSFDGRLFGQSWETPFVPVSAGAIDEAAVAAMIASFHDAYEQRAGHRLEAIPVQGVTYRVHAALPIDKVQYPRLPRREAGGPPSSGSVALQHLGDDEVSAAVYLRADLRHGDAIDGPAIVREPTSTTHIRHGQTATVGERGEILIRRARP